MNFLIDNIFLVGLAVISGVGLLLPMLTQSGAKITTLEATKLINQDSPVIVDVRKPEEFAAAHLREAKSIPLGELRNRIGELDNHKSSPLIVVCQNGRQSTSATAFLRKQGFAQARSLEGGMDSWQSQGLPTVK